MTFDLAPYPVPVHEFAPPETQAWSTAEFFDKHLPDGLTLRALVCSLEHGRWQWSVSSMDKAGGELICAGIERSPAAARLAALFEVSECLRDALA